MLLVASAFLTGGTIVYCLVTGSVWPLPLALLGATCAWVCLKSRSAARLEQDRISSRIEDLTSRSDHLRGYASSSTPSVREDRPRAAMPLPTRQKATTLRKTRPAPQPASLRKRPADPVA